MMEPKPGETKPRLTAQGIRDLNALGPAKKRRDAGEAGSAPTAPPSDTPPATPGAERVVAVDGKPSS
jgi:hypothetical protein